ncbi:MAG: energy transducer TonB [Balneolaceae bacterium]|nr:energy transducer TonB [Balneolaceae bacterium]MBO6546204.1 energy transducer TonB [Balneolaceae bacterium]MBO6648563.1 energy transducer TonB [Balneolaceae bacterium]
MKVPIKITRQTLQKSYRITMELGLILSLTISLLIVRLDFNPAPEKEIARVETQEEIFIEEIVQTKQELKAPAPPRPVVPIEVPNNEIIEDEIIDIDAELDFGEVLDVPPPPKPTNDEDEFESEIFVVVEQPPILIGGISAVQKTIVYPEMAMKAGIEGKVIVQFVIDKNGNVTNPFIVRGIGGGCDEEALRAVKEAKFKPGMQRGRAVQVRYTLPITFRLKNPIQG